MNWGTAIMRPPNGHFGGRNDAPFGLRFASVLAGLAAAILLARPTALHGRQAGENRTVPAGATLQLRLEDPVSTGSSNLNDAVSARVIRDVRTETGAGGVLIPVGAVLRGIVAKVIPSSSPLDRAKLSLKFAQLELPDGAVLPVAGRVSDVENARESVVADGSIQGVLASELPVSMIEGAIEKIRKTNPDMAGEAQKATEQTLGKGDTSITYAPGTDLAFVLDEPVTVERTFAPAASNQLPPQAAEAVTTLLQDAPQRSQDKDGEPGDPLNLVFIGTEAQIRLAFDDAGWAEAEKKTGKSIFETVRAVVIHQGYESAPVSQLYLYGRAEDLAYQKMLNTFAKRHHLRIWKSPVTTSDGREVWLSAATHDVGWDLRPGVVSHAIDPEIDKERSKVGADLIAAGAIASAALVARPDPLSEGLTATGAPWRTDGQLLALELK